MTATRYPPIPLSRDERAALAVLRVLVRAGVLGPTDPEARSRLIQRLNGRGVQSGD